MGVRSVPALVGAPILAAVESAVVPAFGALIHRAANQAAVKIPEVAHGRVTIDSHQPK